MKFPISLFLAFSFYYSFSPNPALGAPPSPAPTPAASHYFTKAILPILRHHCFACHAPDSKPASPLTPTVQEKMIQLEIQNSVDDFQMGPQFPFPNKNPVQKQLALMERELIHHTMPKDVPKEWNLATPLSESDRKILLDWIAQVKNAK
jgi:hypothetical protein